MSRAGKRLERVDYDFYPTPGWCVHRLLDAVGDELPRGTWLEPAVGSGAIVRATGDYCQATQKGPERWVGVDVRRGKLFTSGHIAEFYCADYTWMGCPALGARTFDAVVTNPPYGTAMEFVQESLRRAPVVVMLLRLGWLASEDRADWLRANPPRVMVLPNRPQFDPTKDGTDAADYAWMAWGLGPSRVEVLGSTPAEIRKAHLAEVREVIAKAAGNGAGSLDLFTR